MSQESKTRNPVWFGKTDSIRFSIQGDKVNASNKATGRRIVIHSLKYLTQFGDSIVLQKNVDQRGTYSGEGLLLSDYIKERRSLAAAA